MRFLLLPILLINCQAATAQFQKFLPDHAKLQFAGSIGFLSAGVGYETKNRKLQGDFFYGYVPESVGGIDIHSVSAKLTWLPWTKNYRSARFDLITAGVLVNYAFGKQYFLFDPENYPFDYYKFPTAMHFGIFVGGMARVGRVGFYYEFGTTEKEVLSYLKNTRSIPFNNIINLGLGVRYDLLINGKVFKN